MTPDEVEDLMRAIRDLIEKHHIEDYVYDIRDREMEGWDGPRVTSFAEDTRILKAAIKAYYS